jgi:hypothetical protein
MITIYLAENEPWPLMCSLTALHVELGRWFGEWAWVGRVA